MTENIKGKVVVITGASSGLGEATARRLSSEGASVVLGARRKERIEALALELSAKGGKATAMVTDVTDRAQVKRLVDAAVENYGRIDVMLNNAGLMPQALLEKLQIAEWDRMIDVNLKPGEACCHQEIAQRRGAAVTPPLPFAAQASGAGFLRSHTSWYEPSLALNMAVDGSEEERSVELHREIVLAALARCLLHAYIATAAGHDIKIRALDFGNECELELAAYGLDEALIAAALLGEFTDDH
jgi:hypothetical protein